MQQVHGNQSNRHEHRGQYISYPVLQLLKSIQQEKEYCLPRSAAFLQILTIDVPLLQIGTTPLSNVESGHF